MRKEDWTRRRTMGKSLRLLGRNRDGRSGQPERKQRNHPLILELTAVIRSPRRPQHCREFSALGLRSRHAVALFGFSPPIGSDFRARKKNMTPTATIVIERSIGRVRNPSAITGESASRNCSVA